MDKTKKTYLTPSVKVVNVEAQQILAGSGDAGTEKYTVNPEYSLDDDDFE